MTTNTDDAPIPTVLTGILECALAWEPNARLIGNVRAGDIARVCRTLLLQDLTTTTTGDPIQDVLLRQREPLVTKEIERTLTDNERNRLSRIRTALDLFDPEAIAQEMSEQLQPPTVSPSTGEPPNDPRRPPLPPED